MKNASRLGLVKYNCERAAEPLGNGRSCVLPHGRARGPRVGFAALRPGRANGGYGPPNSWGLARRLT